MKERIKDKQPSVAIIIVNYNGAEDTIECHLVSAIRKGRVLSKGGTCGKNQRGSRAAAEIPSSKKTAK